MSKGKTESAAARVTVTLAPGQRDILERIAKMNGTTIAFVVRYAIKQFIQESERGQLRLDFPLELKNQ